MTDGELEIFANVLVDTHHILVLYRLHMESDFILKTHSLGSTPIQSVSSVHRHVSEYGKRAQIVGSFKLAFPLYFDSIDSTL